MKAHFCSLSLLSRAPPGAKALDSILQRASSPWLSISNRRFHNVARAVAEPSKPPLEDLHGRKHDYLRISLTEKCNLRCKYCMPAEGVPLQPRQKMLSTPEVVRLARTFARLGVRKVRLTGGEPTLRKDLKDIIQEISSIPGIEAVSITTNALVLTRQLPDLQRAGLTHINISLDSLKPERYENMARRAGLSRVLAGIDLALQLGYNPVKINNVLMKGFNDDEICDFAEFTKDRNVEVRFIEFMPFSGNKWDDDRLVPHRQAVKILMERYPDAMPATPRPNDTARVWKIPGYAGSVGFISSMTNQFCKTCNRMRLTADGNLKVCLFGNAEVSLRDAVRAGATDDELEELIRAALRNKKPQHAEHRPIAALRPTTTDNGPTISTATFGPRISAANFTPASEITRHLWEKPASFIPPTLKPTNQVTARAHSTFFIPPIFKPTNHVTARAYSTDNPPILTHLDAEGRARMVNVGDKAVTSRVAAAECTLRVGATLVQVLRDAKLPKGDALTVAQVAGVMGAKRTADLIPMCHTLPLDCANVKIQMPKGDCLEGGEIAIYCEVRVTARTGVEMEALTGAAVAALALYDMCKAVDKHMEITGLRVIRKAGGKSGDWAVPARNQIDQ